MQNGICEIFDLELVGVGILAERPMKLPVLGGKAFDLARLMKPGQKDFAMDAAVLAIDAEPFLKIASNRYGQLEMRQSTAGQVGSNKPAKGPEFLEAARPDGGEFPCQKARGVHQVAAVGQHEVPTLIGLRIARGAPRLCARANDRL